MKKIMFIFTAILLASCTQVQKPNSFECIANNSYQPLHVFYTEDSSVLVVNYPEMILYNSSCIELKNQNDIDVFIKTLKCWETKAKKLKKKTSLVDYKYKVNDSIYFNYPYLNYDGVRINFRNTDKLISALTTGRTEYYENLAEYNQYISDQQNKIDEILKEDCE